ncbi:TetR family transcriptional regulator [Arthrobacter alpinus]|uniref:TetR family transcriptional regulator n=1 Tax=Arthrobacter alpinus TaxID=656366 RepID=A0A0M5LY54_9MICC|nr:TetR family transcriptional regulator [Arthrobacter alpinus]
MGTPATDGRSVRWDAHREERRRELIKATRRAIHRLGSDASMEDIAAKAGTSKSVFYRYFGDKAGLQKAVGKVVIGQMQESIAAARSTARTPREGLVNMVEAYLQMAETSPNVYLFVTSQSDGDSQQTGELSGFFESVAGMISEPLQEMLGGANPPFLGYWPTAAIGLVRTAGELWLKTPPAPSKPDHGAMAQQITTWLIDGVGAQISSQSPLVQ